MNGALSRTRPAPSRGFRVFSGLVRVCLRQMEKGRPAYRTGTTEIALVHFENEFTHGPRVQFLFSFTRRYQCPATTLKARTSTPTTTTPSARPRAAGRPSKATTHLATASRGRTTLRAPAAIREAVSNMAILPAAHPRTSADPSSGALP